MFELYLNVNLLIVFDADFYLILLNTIFLLILDNCLL